MVAGGDFRGDFSEMVKWGRANNFVGQTPFMIYVLTC